MPFELPFHLPDGLTWLRYASMGIVVMMGACRQGLGGIGFAMFAAPIAGLFFPVLAPGPLLVLGGSVSALAAAREFSAIDWRTAGSALSGRVVGTGLAVALMGLLSATLMAI